MDNRLIFLYRQIAFDQWGDAETKVIAPSDVCV